MYELPEIRWIVDRAGVVDTITAFANASDAPDWQKLRSHVAGARDIDSSEFRGIKQTVAIVSDNPQVRGALRGKSQSDIIHN
ncbi:hypothetical protein QUA86_10100 [Microcoleus sp. F6_B6]